MARKWRYLSLAMIAVATFAIAISVGEKAETAPESLELICQVGSATTALSNNTISIPVNVTNYVDSIAGFQLWINISEPSLVKFKADSIRFPNTDSAIYFAKFDTVGCRIRGWEYVQARILDDSIGALLNIIGTADAGGNPIRPPLSPSSGSGLPFIKIICQTKGALGDSLCDSATVGLLLNRSQTRFSDQHGNLIAYSCSSWVDTIYENCAQFVGQPPVCVSWLDTTLVPHSACEFDTTQGLYFDGAVGFACCKCGDANGNGTFSISDVVKIISYIFSGGSAPNPICLGDANGSGTVSISDAVRLIQYIFAGGPAPVCP